MEAQVLCRDTGKNMATVSGEPSKIDDIIFRAEQAARVFIYSTGRKTILFETQQVIIQFLISAKLVVSVCKPQSVCIKVDLL